LYFSTWPRRLARSTGYNPDEIAYGVTKVAAQCLRALSSNEQQEFIHRDLLHKYAKGPAAQLIKYEQTLIDLIQPETDENE
jgi:disulfide oxidoreductase YuzD